MDYRGSRRVCTVLRRQTDNSVTRFERRGGELLRPHRFLCGLVRVTITS